MILTLKGDLSKLDFDIIVVGLTQNLVPESGVARKVLEGIQIENLELGRAQMVDGNGLACKKVIYSVCPTYQDGNNNEDEYLAACYWNSLSLAYQYMYDEKLDRVHVGFSSLATQTSHFPNLDACQIALKTIKRLNNKFPETKAIDICFVCDKTEDYMLYKEVLQLR